MVGYTPSHPTITPTESLYFRPLLEAMLDHDTDLRVN